MSSTSADDALSPWLTRLPPSLARALERSPRASQLARDGVHLVRALTDKPRTSRTFGGGAAALRASSDLRLRVLEVRPETDDASTLVLERPAGLTYLAGQFLTFHLSTGQGPVRRSYSLSSSPCDDGPLAITVKRVPRGAGSTHLTTRVRAGDVLLARGPQGSFVLRADVEAPHLVLVAGGSGITPLRSILREALHRSPARSISLVYANREPRAAIFAGELAALVAAHPGLELSLFFESGAAEVRSTERTVVLEGRLDEAPAARAELERAVRRGGASTEVYLCGPPPMMEHARRVVLELGVPEALVRQERFGSPRAHALTGGPPRTLRVGGRALEVLGGETLLEASSRAGVPLDSSCTMGGCGACRMRLVAGEVELEEPNCLSDDERRQGLVLTCVARPKSDVTLAPVAAG